MEAMAGCFCKQTDTYTYIPVTAYIYMEENLHICITIYEDPVSLPSLASTSFRSIYLVLSKYEFLVLTGAYNMARMVDRQAGWDV